MTNAVNQLQTNLIGNAGSASANKPVTAKAGGTSFSDTFNQAIDEVNKLQSDASAAVRDEVTGKTDNLDGVMVAMEKSDLAFKTLMAIRTKLLDAYEELKNMPI